MRSHFRFALVSIIFMLGAVGPIASTFAQSQIDQSEEQLKIHELQHISAAEAAIMLQKLFPAEFKEGSKLVADERSNSLTIRAPASVQRSIATFLNNSDRPDSKRPASASSAKEDADASEPASSPSSKPSQKKSSAGEDDHLEFKIFHLQNASAPQAAVMLPDIFPEEFRHGEAKVTSDERTNSLILRAPASVLDTIEALLLDLDQTDSKRPQVAGSTKDVGGGITGSLTGMAAKLRRNNTPAAIGSPEFQRYEQEAQAAAQAYRQQRAAAPKDDVRLGQLKADLQGAVHSAFHARQAWQRSQVTEMRKRLDEIEKNISARSQRSNETIEHRVEDLINPERQWESEAASSDRDETKTGQPAQADSAAFPTTRYSSIGLLRLDIATTIQNQLFELLREEQTLLEGHGPLHPKVQAVQRRIKWMKSVLQSAQSFDDSKLQDPSANSAGTLLNDKAQSARNAAGASMTDSGNDPRRELLIAENAVNSAKAAVAETAVEIDAADAILTRIVTAHKTGGVPEKVLLEAQAEVKRKAAALNRMRAELQGKERVLALAKEHLAAQIQIAQLELKQAKSQFDLAAQAEARASQLAKNHSITSQLYEEMLAASEQARISLERATAKYEIYRKALPGTSAPASNQTVEGQPAAEGPASIESGSDPRRELLIAENAVNSAKAAVDEATTDVDATDAMLAGVVAGHQNATVPAKVLLDAQAESKRKAASLNRVRAELQGKERVLALAKEHLAAQIHFVEFELKQVKSEFEEAARQETRAGQLLQSKSISLDEYEKALAVSRQAQISLDRATAKYEFYRKALPGQSAPTGNQTPESQSASERPAGPAKPGEKRE